MGTKKLSVIADSIRNLRAKKVSRVKCGITTFFVLSLCLFACRERIGVDTEASAPRLVIYGYITTDTTSHAIKITRSSGYFASAPPEGISNATVGISCEDDVFELKESSSEPGLYLTSANVFGIPGKTYTFSATIDFNGDGKPETYEASSFLPYPATLDSAEVTQSPIMDEFLQVLIWGDLPEKSSNNFSFHFYRNGEAINDSLQGFYIVQDDYVVEKKIEALPVYQLHQEHENQRIVAGDTIVVQMESITPEYATFIENAQKEYFGSIPLFGGPPANVETNIRSLSPASEVMVSGFFTAFSKDRVTTVFKNQRI